jgi:cation:H+ antiporter
MLLVGGTILVRGASEIAFRYGVSPLIVGLTIVAFGTSAPELAVNISGALQGATDLAFGNVVGSNISNMGLVLGAAALMNPITIQGQVVRREVPLLLLATTAVTVMALDGPLDGRAASISRSEAIVLMLLFLIFVYVNVLDFARTRRPDPLLATIEHAQLVKTDPQSRLSWLLIAAGIILLVVGGDMTVKYGSVLAERIGISETIIGLFVVAVGTSLPELATSIIAAARRESDLALGNVVGSNIFNSLIVLPVSAMFRNIPVPQGGVGDLVVSWSLAALLIPVFIYGEARMGRKTGFFLLAVYFGYAILRTLSDRV